MRCTLSFVIFLFFPTGFLFWRKVLTRQQMCTTTPLTRHKGECWGLCAIIKRKWLREYLLCIRNYHNEYFLFHVNSSLFKGIMINENYRFHSLYFLLFCYVFLQHVISTYVPLKNIKHIGLLHHPSINQIRTYPPITRWSWNQAKIRFLR